MSTHNDEMADRLIEEVARLKAAVTAEHQAANLWRERYERAESDLAAARTDFINAAGACDIHEADADQLREELAAARALLAEARATLPDMTYTERLCARIDAALAGERKP